MIFFWKFDGEVEIYGLFWKFDDEVKILISLNS